MIEKSISEEFIKSLTNSKYHKLVFHKDSTTGTIMIIAIDDITLGPALGGFRILNYTNISNAALDALKLARNMTYKAALAGLDLGGGKSVLIGDSSKIKTEGILKTFGKFVESLNGQYITAPDVNTDTNDMKIIHSTTSRVVGLPNYMGGADDPSVYTALGVFYGLKAALKYTYGSESLKNKNILLEGAGKVGGILLDLISKENPNIYLLEIDKNKIKELAKKYKLNIIDKNDISKYNFDIYSPNALGGTVSKEFLDKIKTKIIVGGANNQLKDPIEDAKYCLKKNITYLPDFLVNAGGLINVAGEYFKNYNPHQIKLDCQQIYSRSINILNKSKNKNIDTYTIALQIAEERINKIKNFNL